MNTIIKHFRQIEEGMTLMDVEEIERLVNGLKIVRRMGGKVWTFGNGGSAATASHFANDLMKIGKVKAVCMSDLYPVVSAYGNDEGWERMYVNPLMRLYNVEKDAAVGISCGGNSENVVRALAWVIETGGTGLGLTGIDDNSKINGLGLLALVHVRVPDIRVQEDLHMAVCHAVVRAMQEAE